MTAMGALALLAVFTGWWAAICEVDAAHDDAQEAYARATATGDRAARRRHGERWHTLDAVKMGALLLPLCALVAYVLDRPATLATLPLMAATLRWVLFDARLNARWQRPWWYVTADPISTTDRWLVMLRRRWNLHPGTVRIAALAVGTLLAFASLVLPLNPW